MNNTIKLAIAAGLILLAIVIFVLTRSASSSAAYSASLSGEIPKPREGSPTFAPADPSFAGGRGKSGRGANAASASNP